MVVSLTFWSVSRDVPRTSVCTVLWMSLDDQLYSGMYSFVFDNAVCSFCDGAKDVRSSLLMFRGGKACAKCTSAGFLAITTLFRGVSELLKYIYDHLGW